MLPGCSGGVAEGLIVSGIDAVDEGAANVA